ncbi:MAG: DUF547 domain-containing protein [Cyanobacteria bacterium P01_H01_bin.121]
MNGLLRHKLAHLTLLGALVAVTGCGIAQSSNSDLDVPAAQTVSDRADAPLDYSAYNKILETYVDEQGLVDYDQLKANRAALDEFNASLGTVTPEQYNSWSDEDQIAFWINAYNSFTLQSIIDQTPLKSSIRDIPGVWRIRAFDIAGEKKTLDNIEHKTLRVDFNEPRLHSGIVCAAISCPPLRREAFEGDRLGEQLDEQTKIFIDSVHGLKIDPDAGEVHLSSIFEWFGEDWIPTYGDPEGFAGNDQEQAVLNFLTQYVSPEEAEYLQAGNYDVKYLNYDWALNVQDK